MRLECRHLNFSYPGTDQNILANINFVMESPGFNCIFGPSGVGKTSFAKLIASPQQMESSRLKLTGIHTVLYSYNLERLQGWANTGSHLDKVCPKEKQDLKKNSLKFFRWNPFCLQDFPNYPLHGVGKGLQKLEYAKEQHSNAGDYECFLDGSINF